MAASVAHDQGRSAEMRLAVSFDGTVDGQTTSTIRLRAADVAGFDIAATRASILGHHRIRQGGESIGFDSEVKLSDARTSAAMLEGVFTILRTGDGTPLGPVGTALAQAVQAALRNFDAHFALTAACCAQGGAVHFAEIRGTSASGAQLTLDRGEGVQYS